MPRLALRCSIYLLMGFLMAAAAQAAVPSGFTDSLVADDVGAPTALAFTPDGRLLITTQGGSLRIFQNGSLLGTAALTISSICTNSEQSLLGVAVDPSFASNNYIYLFYTAEKPGRCVNRVSRFTLPAGNVINPATQMVLVDNMPSPAGNHNAGDVQFGNDGYLYISVGDGGCDYASPASCGGANDGSPTPAMRPALRAAPRSPPTLRGRSTSPVPAASPRRRRRSPSTSRW